MTEEDTRPLLLLVDDEPANLALLERLFRRDYRTISVGSGIEALDILAEEPVDLVLLDIMMPRLSGLETLERIRADERTADLPVILVSALADARDVARGLRLGANDYVSKPIDSEVLNARAQTQIALKRLRDEQKRTIQDLRAAYALKDRFFHIASHDLKSPLSNIVMVQYMLKESLRDRPDVLPFLEMLEISTEAMQAVIRDFLDTAAIQAGELDLQLEDVPVSSIVDDVLKAHRLNALSKDIRFAVGDVDAYVRADHARLAQSLDNLISNALKYSPSGSTIHIFTAVVDGLLRICVADQGPGIPEHDRDRLFTQFGKLSNRPAHGESSTGLGLWIVRNLVTLQGGDVGYEPLDEGGSLFWIGLPLAEPNAEPAAESQPAD